MYFSSQEVPGFGMHLMHLDFAMLEREVEVETSKEQDKEGSHGPFSLLNECAVVRLYGSIASLKDERVTTVAYIHNTFP